MGGTRRGVEQGELSKIWKRATIVLILVLAGLVALYYINPQRMINIKTIGEYSVSFPQGFVDDAIEIHKGSREFKICSISENKCVQFRRLN